jgi:hypothetical protein
MAVLVPLLVGYLVARENGRIGSGIKAGSGSLALPLALDVFIANIETFTRGNQQGTQLAGSVGAVLLFAAGGAVVGATVSWPGTLLGRRRYRHEQPALPVEPPIRLERKGWGLKARWLSILLIAPSTLLIALVPSMTARWASAALDPAEQLLLAAGGLLIGFILVWIAGSRQWIGFASDVLAITCLCTAVVVGTIPFVGVGARLHSVVESVYLVGFLLNLWGLLSRLTGSDRPVNSNVPEEAPVLFRHDGQAIVMYPSRRNLAIQASVWGLLALGWLLFTLLTSGLKGIPPLAAGILLLVMISYGVVPSLLRLLHPWPSLIVDSDGMTDLASAQIFGFGLIPWHEIEGFSFQQRTLGRGVTRLLIYPVNYRRLLQRQPLLKRLFLQRFSPSGRRQIVISALLMPDQPLPAFQRVREFVTSHAPASYLSPKRSPSSDGREGARERS